MTKLGQDHGGETHNTAGVSYWELMDSRPSLRDPAWDQTKPSVCGDNCVAWSGCGP